MNPTIKGTNEAVIYQEISVQIYATLLEKQHFNKKLSKIRDRFFGRENLKWSNHRISQENAN